MEMELEMLVVLVFAVDDNVGCGSVWYFLAMVLVKVVVMVAVLLMRRVNVLMAVLCCAVCLCG